MVLKIVFQEVVDDTQFPASIARKTGKAFLHTIKKIITTETTDSTLGFFKSHAILEFNISKEIRALL